MKKLFTILITLALLCAVGCEEQGNDNVNPNEKPDIENPEDKPDDQIPDDAYIIINKELVTFSPDGESVDIKVYSNYEWKLTNNCDWVTTSVAGGEASDTGTTVTLTAALTYDNHEGTITFSCGKAKKLLVVSQSLKETIIADGNNTFSVPAKGGKVIINYQTSVECEVVIPEESKSWISITPATRALVSESATLTVKENTSYSERNAVVKVVKVGDNTLSAKYTISQKPADKPSVSDTPLADIPCAANEILYTTKYDLPIELGNTQGFGGNLVYNTYENGIGRLTFGNDVTAIPEKAFYNCNSMESIKLPDGIKSVGANAFRNCSSLTTFCGKLASEDGACLIVNGVLEAFAFGSGRTEYIIPNGVTEIGSDAFQNCTSLNSITIPDSVTTIGYSAFFCCTSLTSVTIGNGVTEIGWGAFYGCTGELIINSKIVETDYTPDNYPSYYGWLKYSNFTSLVIGDSVTSIGDYAFWDCTSLTSVTIPDSVISIGSAAFKHCASLTSITIGNGVTSIGNNAFYGCSSLTSVHITDVAAWCGITFVNYSANPLDYAHNLYLNGELVTDLVIPDGVTKIGLSAFRGCSSLTSVTIPDGVTKIGDYAFYGCTGELIINSKIVETDYTRDNYPSYYGWLKYSNFTSLVIGDSVTSIGNEAFSNCKSLTSVTIPDGVTKIGEGAFEYCTALTSVIIGNGVTSIGSYAFWCCTSLTNITIGNSITSIGNSAFSYCSSLTSFHGKFASNDNRCLIIDGTLTSFAPAGLTAYTIPDSVTSIGNSAFDGCTSLTSITIPDSVTEIGTHAFQGCSSLTSVTIGNGVTSIGYYAFYKCTSLKEVYCKPTTPPIGDTYMFHNNASGRKIYVPTESVEAYKTAAWWNKYATDIVGYDFGGGENTTTPPANEIWYTNGSTTEPTTPNKTDVFGATYVSNTYDAEKGCWVIKFDGDVTSIGNFAFDGYTSLTSITIPDSVTSIGEYAFRNCESLTSAIIGNGVIEIGYKAFRGCSSLTSITIPDSVTSIGDDAFLYCDSLTSVTIGNGVVEIGDWAFKNCESLTSITIPDSVTEIGEEAFRDCTSLTSFYGKFASDDNRCLIIDGTLTSFAPAGLTAYTIPDSVTSIGEYAFEGCSSLTSVTIPDSVTSIGYYAFDGCKSLTSITIPDSVTSIGVAAFSDCASLTSVTIPNSVTSIGNSVFRNCVSLKTFYGKFASNDNRCLIVDGVLNSFAPAGLTVYTIPDSVTSIGVAAFRDCASLTNVTIGKGVKTIGNYAFEGCSSLTEVYCKPTTPPRGGYYIFSYYNNYTYRPIGCKIYVPAASVETYKTAEYWSEYAADIVGYDF